MTSEVHSRERRFHDAWASTVDPRGGPVLETFSAATSPEPRWLARRLGELSGKNILDLGTGQGAAAVFFALKGARVTACDLSPGMLDLVGRVAAHHGVHVARHACSAEDLSSFTESSFDAVYAANLLHHVDVARCLDELPLRRQDIDLFAERFSSVELQFFWLTTQAVFLKFYLLDRVHPNAERYWERVIVREHELRRMCTVLEKADHAILRILPFMRWMCWTVAIVARK